MLDEIVVTAQKRTENLQDVPIAVTAITSDDLETHQIVNLQDIKSLVPNFTLDEALSSATTPKMFIRGLGVDNQVFSFDSPIGLYIDGVYMARVTGALVDLFDVERVEVLRGPQGTLYGRNSSVGAIRIITTPAPLDMSDLKADVTFGSRNQRNARLAWGVPLVQDTLGFRLSLDTRNNDGWQREVTTGRHAQAEDIQAMRASLRYAASDHLEMTFRGDYMRDHSAARVGSNFRINPDNDLYTFEESPEAPNRNEVEPWGTSLTVDWDLGAANFTSITAYRELRYRNAGDVDGSAAVRSFEVDRQDLDESQFTQEAFFSGTTLGRANVDWVAGAFYLTEQNDFFWALRIFAPPTTQVFDQRTDSFAPYVQATVPVTDKLSLTGGLRYSEETRDISVIQYLPDGTLNTGFNFVGRQKAEKTNYRAAIDYQASEGLLLYASTGTGFRSGGFNGSARDQDAVLSGSFGPEDAQTSEIGFKADLLDRRLRVNADYFYSQYENLQQAITRSDGTITTENVNANVRGFELEAQVVPVEGWVVSATLGTMQDEIEDSPLELKQTPSLQWRVGSTYSVPLEGRGTLRLGADVNYSADYFSDTNNSPLLKVDSYTMVNANIAYISEDEHWTATLAGYNLTDVFYPIHGFDIAGGFISSVLFTNTPRRWGFTLQYRY
ncbi:MAG TPA: TonB-dependent receptor [Woeseiaceae bacterium]|nr:TonB-dependent receptor [Woeseiaceae bacterium]